MVATKEHTLVTILICELALPINLWGPTPFDSSGTCVNNSNSRFRVCSIVWSGWAIKTLRNPAKWSLVGSSEGACWVEGCWVDSP